MGKGTDIAAIDNPALAKAIDDMKDQLLIILIERLGGRVDVTVDQLDNDTRQKLMTMEIDQGNHDRGAKFTFQVKKKS